tara:strand:+ start:11 stop:895 length:885 start_codon:yes stop_codon:yes gene_type:complete
MNCFPKDVNPQKLLMQLKKIGWKISDLLKSYSQISSDQSEFRKSLKITNLDSGPVTNADLEVNDIILSGIKKNYPSQTWQFLSEENKNIGEIYTKSDWVWIVDPLDGTKDFIKNTGEYAVHVALTFKKKPVLGLVILPSKDEMWIAIEGSHTWCENRNGAEICLAKPNYKSLEDLTIVTSRSHFHPELSNLLEKLKPAKVIGRGSVGYKVASILRGESDMYITYSGPGESCPKDWDMAAPFSILKSAGGTITDKYSKDLKFLQDNKFEQKDLIIASLNINHESVCKEILDKFLN